MNSTGISRRSFARLAGVGVAGAAVAPTLLAARRPRPSRVVRLSANENPYGPSAAALDTIRDSLSLVNRYPDEHEEQLAADLARLHGVPSEQILLSNGSSEALKLAAVAFTGANRSLVVAKPTFEAVAGHAVISGAPVLEVPLTSDYRHDLEKMAAAQNAGLIYVCNPNNPTASITPKDEIHAFLAGVAQQTTVLVDEAYHHYVESSRYESLIPLVNSHPNLVVLRTFSKIYGMAGLRCGYAVAQKETLDRMRRHQAWNSMNVAALVAARASVADTAHVERNRRRNSGTRSAVVRRLAALGFETIPSQANFIMVDVGREVRPVIQAMRSRGVGVGRLFPALPTHLRVTIGRPEEMERFLEALPEAIARRAA